MTFDYSKPASNNRGRKEAERTAPGHEEGDREEAVVGVDIPIKGKEARAIPRLDCGHHGWWLHRPQEMAPAQKSSVLM